MDDLMIRVIGREAGIRGFVCLTTGLVNEVATRHQASPTAAAALGQIFTAGALLGGLLKVQQTVALKVQGNGPLRKMVVEADAYGRLRGYVEPSDVQLPQHLPADDVAAAVGDLGLLTVVKDVQLKELAEGVVPLQTGKLDVDLIFYLMQSEQVPSLVEIDTRLAAKGHVAVAGGYLLQLMPDHEPDAMRNLAERMEDLPRIGELLANSASLDTVVHSLFQGLDYEILERTPLRFECSCSWERSEQALMTLGREDLETLIAEGEAVVDCHYCRERYIFGREALEMIVEKVLS